MRDQLVTKTTIYKSHNQYTRRKSKPSAGYEPAIPAIQRQQTYDLDRTANGIDHDDLITLLFFPFQIGYKILKKFYSQKYTTNSIHFQKTQFTAALCQRGFMCYRNFISGISFLQLKPYCYTSATAQDHRAVCMQGSMCGFVIPTLATAHT